MISKPVGLYLLGNKTVVFLLYIDGEINTFDYNTVIQKSMDTFQMLSIALTIT